ncbi:alpha/beta fold hydrolase [Nocardioides yefusunii]|uniref:Alpha/beta fold hydrolase n=1 Tax=Nocardioides yefusunii TaxID=2500546 RepID=A0ABW1QZZ0_9ACTN|nr:alpha/beta hydrolase [Nocardioides yefusunii]
MTQACPVQSGSAGALGIDLGAHLDQFADLPSGIRICFRDLPPRPGVTPHPVPVVLVGGLSLEQSFWPRGFLDRLAEGGLRVITLDNRDAGRSTHLEEQQRATKLQLLRARPPQGAYTIEDMAEDVVGLLDHLDLDQVHLVGMSMGGMISQTVASTHPFRVLSLTSIFSTTGNPKVGQPARSTLLRLARRAPRNEMEHVAAHLGMTQHLAGWAFRPDVEQEVVVALRNWRRGAGLGNSAATQRQISAIQASGDRTASLGRITAPTLVVHGDRDPMVAPSGGRATHDAIPGSTLEDIPGMGHHIGPEVDRELAILVEHHAFAAWHREQMAALKE